MLCFSIDLDGTLLTASKTISQKNLDAIDQLLQRGDRLLINTGRSEEEVALIKEISGLDCIISCCNGAKIYRNQSKEILKTQPISNLSYYRVINTLLPFNPYIETFTNQGVFCQDKPLHSSWLEIKTENYHDLAKRPGIEIYRCSVTYQGEQELNFFSQELKHLKDLSFANMPPILEITSKDANKGHALHYVAELYDIPMSNTVVLGDQGNDISMFQVAGTKVAMGNAIDELKNLAHFITKTNDEDGVAYAIEYLT
jgi:Cof subfamily protein (haloacid dehalogenase superfamily)